MKKLQLQIPIPCHESWDNMIAAEKGKFCISCQKKVIDFSNMSDREVAMLFKKPSANSLCGRFTEDQLNRDIEIPKKRIPWVKYFFQFAIPAFLVSLKISAQQNKLQGKVEAVCITDIKKDKNDLINQSIDDKITGRVVDENGNPIPYATVIIKNTKIGVATDSMGFFMLQPKHNWENTTLSVSSIGFISTEKSLNRSDLKNNIEIFLKLSPTSNNKVIVVGYASRTIRCTMGAVSVRWYENKSKQVFDSTLKIYPNPVKSNSALHIEWNYKDFGYQSLQLFNQSGQLVFTNELYIDGEARLLNINVPQVAAGSYFLKITNKTTCKSFTEKLIVQ